MIHLPRSISSIAFIMVGFSVLIIIPSLLSSSHPITTFIQAYFQPAQVQPSVSGSKTSKISESSSQSCDLYNGRWIYDPQGPLYDTCATIAEEQNCKMNGRQDKEYEKWRWKPDHCDLPRFDIKKFMQLMKNKTLAFVGDSLARNQMQSLLCILMQEVKNPVNHGYHKGTLRVKRWYFGSTVIARIWSALLVDTTEEPVSFAPKGVLKVHLDKPDKHLMEFLPNFDVVVISLGHWFGKQSVHVLNNKIVGGQQWWPKEAGEKKISTVDAFGISVETILTAIANHPNFTGLVILRSFSPDHYEGGAWNTGGSCTGKQQPASEVVKNEYTDAMHYKQIKGFENVVKRVNGRGGSKFRFMDITKMFGYRHDGHPGPYRNKDPNKATNRGPNGKPPPQDCLHWCMPGAVDTWNEILLEIIRREFEGD